MIMFEQKLKDHLKKELGEDVVLEIPPDFSMGDYALTCFTFAKKLKKNPNQIAQDFVKQIKKPDFVEKLETKGAYVNFFLKKSKLAERLLSNIFKEKDDYGSAKLGKGKTIVIDFSSPNIAKPFSIGHLRSTMIGNSLYKIHTKLGYKVVRVNHLGDWGTQFGKLIVAHLKWGDKNRLKKEPIQYLLDIYVRFHEEAEKNKELEDQAREWFKKLEDGDAQAQKLWAEFKHLSLDEFRKLYDILGVDFDSYNGESFYNDKIEDAIKTVEKKDICELNEGALIVPLKTMTPLMLRKSDEASTYAARDLAAIFYRIKTYKPEKIIYVVGAEQTLHFQQLFSVAELCGISKEKLTHVAFGLYRFPEGKMSTRKGKVIFMEDVLNKSIELARKVIDEKNPKLNDKENVAQVVGVGAIIFGDLVNDRVKDVLFDWNKILDFEGDTAPYLQYTYARASSIIRKAKEEKLIVSEKVDFEMIKEEVEQRLVSKLSRFQNSIFDALNNYKPHIIAQYLLELARTFNEFYHKCPCIQEKDKDVKTARLLLIDCSRQVIRNGLDLLSIRLVEEM